MKRMLLIAAFLAAGWYGHDLYNQDALPFMQGSSIGSVHAGMTKCITKDGSVIYGAVPLGTVCEKTVPVAGSLTIVPGTSSTQSTVDEHPSRDTAGSGAGYQCDGRTHCSQMSSCEEATFFLRNCPNVKMDGNADGIPCEKQWCK
jgi:hypothetical protein